MSARMTALPASPPPARPTRGLRTCAPGIERSAQEFRTAAGWPPREQGHARDARRVAGFA
jgi:hypothetical protein